MNQMNRTYPGYNRSMPQGQTRGGCPPARPMPAQSCGCSHQGSMPERERPCSPRRAMPECERPCPPRRAMPECERPCPPKEAMPECERPCPPKKAMPECERPCPQPKPMPEQTCGCQEDDALPRDRQKLLSYIDEVSFGAFEALLYLDTHPCDEQALAYFRVHNEKRNAALSLYTRLYGPLNLAFAGDTCDRIWEWANQPWPWEGGNC